MEDIPLRVSMEDRTFDHDESDCLLSNVPTADVQFRRGKRRRPGLFLERYTNSPCYHQWLGLIQVVGEGLCNVAAENRNWNLELCHSGRTFLIIIHQTKLATKNIISSLSFQRYFSYSFYLFITYGNNKLSLFSGPIPTIQVLPKPLFPSYGM